MGPKIYFGRYEYEPNISSALLLISDNRRRRRRDC